MFGGAQHPAAPWRARDKAISLARPVIMGVLNVTPDSFHDGGRYADPDAAAARARIMADEGADIIDVGGESTRPGSVGIDAAEEMRRVLPVITKIAGVVAAAVSVDTSKADVARAALDAGADMVNDVTALGDPRMAAVVAAFKAGLVLMHMHGAPGTMQEQPMDEAHVVDAVLDLLRMRVAAAEAAGIARSCIAVDPGIGFGKSTEANELLIRHLHRLGDVGLPIVVGASRKSFIGQRTGRGTEDRLAGSLAAHVLAYACGAHVIRTHDVRATRDALAVAQAICGR